MVNRLSLRLLSALALAGSVAAWAGCADATDHHADPVAQLALKPVFPEALAGGAFNLAIDTVRVRVVRPPAERVVDTLVAFPADSTQIAIKLSIPLAKSQERLTVSLDLSSHGRVLFKGSATAELLDAASVSPPIPLEYVGPGTEVTALRLEPSDTLLGLGGVFRFSVRAFSGSTPLDSFYVGWSSSDPAFAPVDAMGTVRAPNSRGHVVLGVVSPTGIKDRTTVHFAPPPTTIQASGGDGQSGTAGLSLSVPFTVLVLADDQLGVPRVRVRFTALSSGRVRDTLVMTDEAGFASTVGILGPKPGPQVFQASVSTLSPVSFFVTAQTGPPSSVVPSSGNGQTDTVRHILREPLAARITDAVGNPLGGVPVSWSVVSGGGTLDRTSSVSDSAGIARVTYTLGRLAGQNRVWASAPGALVVAEFVATAVPDSPASLRIIAGDGQSDVTGATLQPFVVSVSDSLGNLLPGITVRWSEVEGGGLLSPTASTTNSEGRAQTTYRLPALPGEVHVTAEVPGTALRVVLRATALPPP